MIPLKEDGSPDVEFINKLPHDDYVDIISSMTTEQLEYYWAETPSEDNDSPVIPIKVDYGFDDPRSGVDADKFLRQMRRRLEKRGCKFSDD